MIQNSVFQTKVWAINLTMGSQQLEAKKERRTSERRRLKLLRNSNQFRIPNPFKIRHNPLPKHIASQLSHIDYLSASAILTLAPYRHLQPREDSQLTLASMHEAIVMQQHRYCALLGTEHLKAMHQAQNICSTEQSKKETLDFENKDKKSQFPQRNIYDPLDPRKQDDFPVLGLIEGNEGQNEVKGNINEQNHHQIPILVQQEIQNYFAQ